MNAFEEAFVEAVGKAAKDQEAGVTDGPTTLDVLEHLAEVYSIENPGRAETFAMAAADAVMSVTS